MSQKVIINDLKIEEVRRLYEDELLSDRKISKKLGVSRNVIRRVIRENKFKQVKVNVHPQLPKGFLYQKYVVEKKSVREIVEETQVPKNFIIKSLDSCGIRRRTQWERSCQFTKELLEDLYINKNYTQKDISELKGVSISAVSNALKKFKIVKDNRVRTVITIPIELLKDMYIANKMPISKIAQAFGCNAATIKDRLERAGIIEMKEKVKPRVAEVLKQLCEEGKGNKEIMNVLGCSRRTLSRWMASLGLTFQTKSLDKVTREELYDLLIIKGIDRKKVAQMYNVSISTLQNRYSELGITLVTASKKCTKEILEDMYYNKGMLQEEIAKALGISRSTVSQKFQEYGIKKKFKWEMITKEQLYKLYVEENLPPIVIAERLGLGKEGAAPIRRKVIEWGLHNLKTEEQNEACKDKAYEISLACSRSKGEQEIEELFPTEYKNVSSVIGLELDLYYPELKLAVEYNGDYWHSTRFNRNSGLHLAKLAMCKNNGIRLINIFEREWHRRATRRCLIEHLTRIIKPDTLKEVVGNKVKKACLYIRDTFENQNNVLGYKEAEEAYGIFKNGELLSSVSYIKEDGVCKVIRFTTKRGYREDDIISYMPIFEKIKGVEGVPIVVQLDQRYYDDHFMKGSSFKFIRNIESELYYVHSRKALRKEEATEEYLNNPKCYPVYDCGFSEWVLK